MVNKVVPREELREATEAWANKLAGQDRLGNWLTKQSVNHVEELRGKRSAMDAVFHMHHFAHAQNDLVKGDSIAGVTGKSAAERQQEGRRMNLEYTPEQRAFRPKSGRGWRPTCLRTRLPSFDLTREGFEAHREWERTLNEGQWGMVTWPEAYGGRALDLIRWLIFEEEYYRAGAPTRVNQNGIFLLGPTMMEFGTDEQKARFLTRMAAGDDIWAQAWSEPGAGSDLAAVRSTAPVTATNTSSTARKSGRPARSLPIGPSACSASRAASATRA